MNIIQKEKTKNIFRNTNFPFDKKDTPECIFGKTNFSFEKKHDNNCKHFNPLIITEINSGKKYFINAKIINNALKLTDLTLIPI